MRLWCYHHSLVHIKVHSRFDDSFTKPFSSVQFSSVTQSCLTLCYPMNHSTPGLSVHHQLPKSTQTHLYWVSDAIQPSHPLSSPSPPALFPSIRVFSNESTLCIMWTKYWSFSFKISPTNEHLGLISFRELVGSPCSPRDSPESSPTPQFFGTQLSL